MEMGMEGEEAVGMELVGEVDVGEGVGCAEGGGEEFGRARAREG
jgi:hypothetical protein